jgi:hypothetical protein
MSTRHLKTLCAAGALALTLTALPGCKLFDVGNPFLPKARLVAFPTPSMVNVASTYSITDGTVQTTGPDPSITVTTLPLDASPGVLFNSYSAEYFDQANNSIPTLVLTKVNFGVSAYLPPASGGPSTVALTLPIYNQQVRLYAVDQVFSFNPQPFLNRDLIHSISCRGTLFGVDDNFNEIQVPFNVPFRFEGNVTL